MSLPSSVVALSPFLLLQSKSDIPSYFCYLKRHHSIAVFTSDVWVGYSTSFETLHLQIKMCCPFKGGICDFGERLFVDISTPHSNKYPPPPPLLLFYHPSRSRCLSLSTSIPFPLSWVQARTRLLLFAWNNVVWLGPTMFVTLFTEPRLRTHGQ